MKVECFGFEGFLNVRALEGELYELLSDFSVKLVIDGKAVGCTIPKGFITDFCSVPRVPLAFTLFGGKYARSGTIHDGLYSGWPQVQLRVFPTDECIPITRELADEILYQVLRYEGASWFTAASMHRGVRLFGGAFYQGAKGCLY